MGRFPLALLVPFFTAFAGTGHFCDYASFYSQPVSGYFGDGFVSDGPFRANHPIQIWSASPGRDGDPWFYSLTLASPFYYCSPSGGSNPQTTPQYGDLWIEPYELMSQGPPWFVLGAEPLVFGPDSVNWQEMYSAAVTGGIVLNQSLAPNGTRMLLAGDSLFVKTANTAPIQAYDLSGLAEPVVWIENSPSDKVYIKSAPGDSLAMPVSIGMNGSLYVMGPLSVTRDESGGMLGLLSVHGYLVIALDPELVGMADWTDPAWRIDTEDDFEFCASVICLEGELCAENPSFPDPSASLVIFGSVQSETAGFVSTGARGWNVSVGYDWRLSDVCPPHYPGFTETSIGGGSRGDVPGMSITAVPDPFASPLEVSVGMEGAGEPVMLEAFDMAGRLLVRATSTDGVFMLDGEGLPAGVILLRASAGSGTASAYARVVHIR